ncbi:rhodanese-like domain-containing protein [Paenibacillus sp. alder61]|uniref:Rhodanese-like domain-containing protein n=1 Tax=Paenibacillus faecis TaxID=862114 RepID=A0A5D0CQQ5_9BACL|nr:MULTISPECIES: rhodanese-like domain-containing protein [Paenibacillus]MCA1292599.1 rhodanese-like domain-containing protein [Paenibacillus sp. alder61]TYA11644.1 rhodanese-like domain-containing protein [Paenibacillus faecis]
MMAVTAIVLLALAGWTVYRLRPVKGLAFVEPGQLRESANLKGEAKLVDIRDAVYYEQGHVQGAINISLGRLPFVWSKELSPDEPVIILSCSLYQSKRAARMLKNRGFRQIYAVRGGFCA